MRCQARHVCPCVLRALLAFALVSSPPCASNPSLLSPAPPHSLSSPRDGRAAVGGLVVQNLVRLGGGRGGARRSSKQKKAADARTSKTLRRMAKSGEHVQTMAPPIHREEEEDGGGGKLSSSKQLKKRSKWGNPHVSGRRLSRRQARVQRASRDVAASCRAAVMPAPTHLLATSAPACAPSVAGHCFAPSHCCALVQVDRVRFLQAARQPRAERPAPRPPPLTSDAPPPSTAPCWAANGSTSFVPAEAFGEGREGFVFKLGREGLGYYRDDISREALEAERERAAAAGGRGKRAFGSSRRTVKIKGGVSGRGAAGEGAGGLLADPDGEASKAASGSGGARSGEGEGATLGAGGGGGGLGGGGGESSEAEDAMLADVSGRGDADHESSTSVGMPLGGIGGAREESNREKARLWRLGSRGATTNEMPWLSRR